ncbi:MAG TPA: hypothetical protein VHK27_15300 [Gammaproteobacteria bacterium]|nr:hypothetical protein [Gammaproteobacteria bacterium]
MNTNLTPEECENLPPGTVILAPQGIIYVKDEIGEWDLYYYSYSSQYAPGNGVIIGQMPEEFE